MKYLSITFDDGRIDNHTFAFPIMKNNNLTATLFCTTGYIDGTWQGGSAWKSASGPLTIENIRALKEAGWEISLHGDCHTTNLSDLISAHKKLKEWELLSDSAGYSIPNSNASQADISTIAESGYVSYIRGGKKRNTKKLSSKILFGLHHFLKIKWAYNRFNLPSINHVPSSDKYNLGSIAVRRGDDPNTIINFIKKAPDNTWIILMLHSILPSDDILYNTDSWCYSNNDFSHLCEGLSQLSSANNVTILNVNDMIERFF